MTPSRAPRTSIQIMSASETGTKKQHSYVFSSSLLFTRNLACPLKSGSRSNLGASRRFIGGRPLADIQHADFIYIVNLFLSYSSYSHSKTIQAGRRGCARCDREL